MSEHYLRDPHIFRRALLTLLLVQVLLRSRDKLLPSVSSRVLKRLKELVKSPNPPPRLARNEPFLPCLPPSAEKSNRSLPPHSKHQKLGSVFTPSPLFLSDLWFSLSGGNTLEGKRGTARNTTLENWVLQSIFLMCLQSSQLCPHWLKCRCKSTLVQFLKFKSFSQWIVACLTNCVYDFAVKINKM